MTIRKRWTPSPAGVPTGAAVTAAVLLAGALTSCAINPATGKRQLSLIGESQEIAMGREADGGIIASLGGYDDVALQAYVQRLGRRLAASSERPELPWTFQVVDDPVVNAFALPGGFIYVTRGILAQFESEAELAAVLGHEIGHVTARHSVNQISKQQLAGIGLGVGTLIEPELERFSQLTGTGLGLLFLKFSRDDERQADDLGLRYLVRAGYDPAAMVDVFDMLHRVSEAGGGGRVPGWLSTHPAPENRSERIRQALSAQGLSPGSGTVARQTYLAALDGLVYGDDPRQGLFRDGVFHHPQMAFSLRFPEGWEASNQRQAVVAVSPEEDAAAQLTLAAGESPGVAADGFFARDGLRKGAAWRSEVNGLPVDSAYFTVPAAAESTAGDLSGLAVFIGHQERVFQLLGYSTAAGWPARRAAVEASLASFRKLTDRAILSVEPRRLRVATLSSPQTLADLQRREPSTVPLDSLALLNRVDPGQRLPAGSLVKRVVGGP